MENRGPAPTGAATGKRARRTRVLLAGGVLIVLILVVAARLLAPGAADPWRDRGGQTVVHVDPPVQAAAIEPATRPALIIDAAAAASDNPPALVQAAGAGDHSLPAAADAPRVEAARSTATAAPAAKAPRAAAPARAGDTARAEPPDAAGGLLATLLGIIRHEGPAGPTAAQRELQSCPAANTVQGIHCRDRICARWAGLDPACPAR